MGKSTVVDIKAETIGSLGAPTPSVPLLASLPLGSYVDNLAGMSEVSVRTLKTVFSNLMRVS